MKKNYVSITLTFIMGIMITLSVILSFKASSPKTVSASSRFVDCFISENPDRFTVEILQLENASSETMRIVKDNYNNHEYLVYEKSNAICICPLDK